MVLLYGFAAHTQKQTLFLSVYLHGFRLDFILIPGVERRRENLLPHCFEVKKR